MTVPTHAWRGWLSPTMVVTALIVVVVDQLTKEWALSTLADRDIDVFWTLRFNLSFNTGMAFSQGEGWGPVIGVLALVVIVALVLSLRRQPGRLTDISVGLIVGGALGNVFDRLFRSPGWLRGAVVDFIDFQWFPIFNVADSAITIGGVLLVLASWRAGRHEALSSAADGAAVDASTDEPVADRVAFDVSESGESVDDRGQLDAGEAGEPGRSDREADR